MTIVQRTFSAAFRSADLQHWGTRSLPEASQVETCDAPRQSGTAAMTCTPWEGLYFEAEESVSESAAASTNGPVSELERFLAGIMYGE